MTNVFCPICWHEETWRAIRQQTEPVRDDMPDMRWHRPDGGPRGQIATMWDGGHWRCEVCGISLPPRMAAVLIDAVLRVSDPDSDSYNPEEKTFADAMVAAKGGGLSRLPPSPCGKACDHGSPCLLPMAHAPADRHETEHGCVFFDPRGSVSGTDAVCTRSVSGEQYLGVGRNGDCDCADDFTCAEHRGGHVLRDPK